MSDKKKKKEKFTKKKANNNEGDPNKLSKEEDAIARFVRFNCPTNTTMFEGNEVHYFSGKKAADLLVESKKYGANAKVPKFPNSAEAENFLQMLLEKGLFFRAKKMVLKKKDKAQELKSAGSRDVSKSPRVGKKEKKAQQQQEEAEQAEETEDKGGEEKADQDEEKDKKKKKKVKLLFEEIQVFDANTTDVYVWVFDPTPFWKKCVGILMVLGTIGGCLFPLWPEWLRLGVYYLSVTGIALFGLLLGVALARTILFGLIWLFTMGRHHLWVLPNLMEDCGFFESFKPFYTYEYVPGGVFAKNEPKKKKKDKKTKEEDEEKEPLVENENGVGKEQDQDAEKPEPLPDKPKATDADNEHAEEGERQEQEEDEAESADNQSVTDDSNSWENLSENSQKSAENNGESPKE